MKCLVVDASGLTRRTLVRVLDSLGFDTVIEASNGHQAFEVCDPTLDLVVTGWSLPGLSGIDLVRSIRLRPDVSALPILMVTDRIERLHVVEALDAGVDGYVIRPFALDTFRDKVMDVLDARSEESEAQG